VTNAWISHPDTPAYLWKENEGLVASGLIDFQAHGVIHNTPIEEGLPEEYVRNEIFGPVSAIEQHFGKRPIALIWPRGLFTPHAVDLARQAGYQVGFTAYARGPLLFNWIPLGAEEQKANDPVMVLPRYWDTTAIAALDEAVQISQAAQTFYSQQRSLEMSYIAQYCSN
jgi:peptidoglycan/xylan/chitin deacetylase (PgdA/CDA1 family)